MHILYLGDSYTCGQGVSPACSYPEMLSNLIHIKTGLEIHNTIIATTGWQTSQLLERILQLEPTKVSFDMVFLCIGVNDAYDGVPLRIFRENFDRLVNKVNSLLLPRGNLVLLNIPNYGYSPKCRIELNRITSLIKPFNLYITTYANTYNLSIVDLEGLSQLQDTAYFAADGLHPSALQYKLWVETIYTHIETFLLIYVSDLSK